MNLLRDKAVLLLETAMIDLHTIGCGEAGQGAPTPCPADLMSVQCSHYVCVYNTVKAHMAADNQTERLQMRVSADFLAKVDEWRRAQPDLPNRSEAIRRLVELALTGGKGK